MKVVVMDDSGQVADLPNLKDVPSWLRRNRAQKRLSMQDLGDRLGVTKQAVYSWEQGLVSPTTDNLAKLVALFAQIPVQKTKNTVEHAKTRLDAIDALLRPHARNVTR